MTAIETEGLRKSFGQVRALRGVDLAVPDGSVCALLGPNGAGKTTVVRVLATLTRPDGGTARVAGHDVVREPRQVRASIGLAGQHSAVDDDLTGHENLFILGLMWHLGRRRARARAAELLERFELADAGGRLVKTWSGGMRRRLDLVASLIVAPTVLFLDEPTTGLDPRSRSEIWSAVRSLAAEGTTVLLTTQYLDEADQLAHDIVVIDHGKVIATGTPDELKDKSGGQVLEVEPADRNMLEVAAAVLANRTGAVPDTNADSGLVRVPVADAAVLPAIIRELDEARVELAEFSLRKASLDEVFLTLTGNRSQDQPADDYDVLRELERTSR